MASRAPAGWSRSIARIPRSIPPSRSRGLQASETVVGLDVRAGGATPGELYALGSTGRLYTVNTTTGVATLKSTLAADPADTTDAFTALSGTEFGVDFNPVVGPAARRE